jgi:prevent-host-death family protein
MKSMSARDAKNAFGLLLDTARAEPVAVEKHGRPVVVVLSVEEFERMKLRCSSAGENAAVEDEEVAAGGRLQKGSPARVKARS